MLGTAGVLGVSYFVPPGGQTAETAAPANAYYRYCSDARVAGVAPMYRDQPGFRNELDRDGDGVACEPYFGN